MQESAYTPEELSGDLLALHYVPLDQAKAWDRNPKLHDLQKLVESIEIHGFRDPPAYDAALDAFVEGNGRTEALMWMFNQNRSAPRGVATHRETGRWCIPVIFGVDAASRLAAERYGIDHNNLVLAGGDFTAIDLSRNWTAAYTTILQDLASADQLPVSVDADDLDSIIAAAMADEEIDSEPSDGSLLALSNITIAAPRHEVETGDIWTVGGHLLICIDVMAGWGLWAPHLEGENTIFVPYPGPFAPLTIKAGRTRMIMVQPDPYVAGHILDRYEEVHGADSIGKN